VIFSDPPLDFRQRVVLLESVTVIGDDLPRTIASVVVRITLLPAIFALTFTRQPFGAVEAQVSVNFRTAPRPEFARHLTRQIFDRAAGP